MPPRDIARDSAVVLDPDGTLGAFRKTLAALVDEDCRFAPLEAHMAVEVRPAGEGKGSALATPIAAPPFAGRLTVFAGDAVTDEDAIAADLRCLGWASSWIFPSRPRRCSTRCRRGGGCSPILGAYDLLGTQTGRDARNLRDALGQIGCAAAAAAFPVGMHADALAREAARAAAQPEPRRLAESAADGR